MKYMKKGGRSRFPDLNNDGKITMADILKGRGVGRRKRKAAGGMYVRPGKQMGVGGALLTLGKNIAQGKKLGSGVLKGVGRAAVTPGSGIGAGAGLVGALAGKSKNPMIQKIGKGVAGVGQIAGMFTGGGGAGGGILQKAGKLLKGGGGPGGGMIQNIAGNVLGGQGGQGAGILQNLAGKFLAKDGMKVSYGDGGKMSYGHGGSMMEERKPMLVIKMDEGGITDPIPNGTGNGNGNGDPVPTDAGGLPSREYITTTFDLDYSDADEMEGFQEGSTDHLGAINKNFDLKTQSFNDLDDEMKQNLRNSPFGQRYFSEDGDMDVEYKNYVGEVNQFFENTPKETILGRINEMAAASPNFAKGIEDAKTDEEKLTAARRLMTDGKIGEYHGALLGTKTLSKALTTYNPHKQGMGGFSTSDGDIYDRDYIVSVGNRFIDPNAFKGYMEDALEAGIDITNPSNKTGAWIESWMDENPDAVQKPGVRGRQYSVPFADQAKSNEATRLQGGSGSGSRREVAELEAKLRNAKIRGTEEQVRALEAALAEAKKGPVLEDRYNFSQFSQAMGGSVNPFKVLKR